MTNPVSTIKDPASNVKAKPMNLTELAQLYGVCAKTFKKWIEPFSAEIGKTPGTYIFTTKQVEIIYNKIGEP